LLLAPAIVSAAVISADLRARLDQGVLDQGALDQYSPVILNLVEQVDPALYTGGRSTASSLITDLRDTATRSQAPVLAWLRVRAPELEVQNFWISNSLALRATPELIHELAELAELASIDLDVPVRLPEVTARLDGEGDPGRDPVWSLETIGVPQVWDEFGLMGEGIVIGSMDTGVDIDHPALHGKWRGGDNSWLDLVNDLPDPYDDQGHGTHTIGTLVGGDGPGPFDPDIGVAPGAQFISVKVLDHNGSFSNASIVIAGAQWILDPDGDPGTDDFPHVVNNSWYFFSMTYTGFHASVEAWRAAGIIPVFCLGNEGPNASTTRPPANYGNLLGIGATTIADQIWYYSSRGPTPAGWAFPDDRRKPDLSAPGANVTSSLPGGSYAAWSGTSMATPHVAGVAALMLQLRPDLNYDQIYAGLIGNVVDLGAVGYDHDFGYGRLDAHATIAALALTAVPEVAPRPAAFVLHPCRPNPFNPVTTIAIELAASGVVEFGVFDLRGHRVAVLVSGELAAGRHELVWDGRDAAGRTMPAGNYCGRLSTDWGAATTMMMMVK